MSWTNKVMEKPNQDQKQLPFNCPRCDSSNTKFCYFNNYSLSQPRHFCKSCKRYWTRGGTLRNVPVGGGSRKHKRVKPPPCATSNSSTHPSVQPHTDHYLSNPLFYGMPNNPHELALSYSSFSSTRVSRFDARPHINGFNTEQAQDDITSTSVLSRNPIYGSSTMASFLEQQNIQETNVFPELFRSADMQIPGNGIIMGKEVKIEEADQSRLDNWLLAPCQNRIEEINSSDLSLLWNTAGVGTCFDPSNMGSFVPSFI